MKYAIRCAQPCDVDALREVFRRSSLSNEGDRAALFANPEVLVFDAAPVEEQRTRVAVGDEGRIVGFSTVALAADVAELEDLFVDPDCMRRGVGTELVRDLTGMAQARGALRIEVTANDHARDFYEAVGFVFVHVAPTRFGPASRMHLDLETEDD